MNRKSAARRTARVSPSRPAVSPQSLPRSGDADAGHGGRTVAGAGHLAQRILGDDACSRGDFTAAARHYEEALAGGGPEAELFANLGAVWLQLGEPDKAAEVLTRAAARADATARTYYNLGVALRALRFDGFAAAAYEQALARDPLNFQAMINLANVYMEQDRYVEAAGLFRRALSLRPDDASLEFLVSAMEGRAPDRAPPAFVTRLFDQYAETFEHHLTCSLGYDTPKAMRRALDAHRAADERFERGLDLGCGTGLAGLALADRCDALVGVDLSPRMLDRARAKGVYADLVVGDLLEFLTEDRRSYDLLVAADVLIYVGALEPLLEGARARVCPGALFLVTTEELAADAAKDDGFRLGLDARFAHARGDVLATATGRGWSVLEDSSLSIRLERGREVPGRLYVLRAEG